MLTLLPPSSAPAPLIPAAVAAALSGAAPREAILAAAHTAATRTPWPQVELAEVAAQARLSLAAVYHEFGGKGGLAFAVVARAVRVLLDGADTAIAAAVRRGGSGDVLAALAAHVVDAGRDPLGRALLTGDRSGPSGVLLTAVTGAAPTPIDLVEYLRARGAIALASVFPGTDLAPLVEGAVRTALSYLVAPPREPALAPAPAAGPQAETGLAPVVPLQSRGHK